MKELKSKVLCIPNTTKYCVRSVICIEIVCYSLLSLSLVFFIIVLNTISISVHMYSILEVENEIVLRKTSLMKWFRYNIHDDP